jgi:hypothetical protein
MGKNNPDIKPAAVVIFLELPTHDGSWLEFLDQWIDVVMGHPDIKEIAGPYINGLIAVTFQTEFSDEEMAPFRPYMTFMQAEWDKAKGETESE